MIVREGDRVLVSGRVTMADAAALLEEGRPHVASGSLTFDLAGVTEADSSALAVLFGWLREAHQRSLQLSFSNTPATLLSLAEVYGVSDLLTQR
jgi:phospholipid transport system transporter-binding protein